MRGHAGKGRARQGRRMVARKEKREKRGEEVMEAGMMERWEGGVVGYRRLERNEKGLTGGRKEEGKKENEMGKK